MKSNIDSIVTINESGIILHTGLSSRQFANAKMGQYIAAPGIFILTTGNEYTKEEFRFTDTQTIPYEKSDTVILTNKTIQGETLLSILEGNNTKKALQTVEKLCALLEWSFTQGIEIANCGPVGIIVTENGFLFLPFELFERSILAQNKETASLLYGCWTNTSLNYKDSWRFTLSTYLYASISNKKPYSELDSEKRAEDYYDNNFVPLHILAKVNENLAQIINHNLSLTEKAHKSIKPQRQKSRSITSKILDLDNKSETNSTPIPLPISDIEIHKDDTALTHAQNTFAEKKSKELRRKRFLRKNKVSIAVVSLILIFVGIITTSIIKSNLSKPTTKDMTEMQVVQAFYTAINNLDSIALDSCGSSKAIKSYSNLVSNLYVSGKMREAYEHTVSFLPPAQWVGLNNPEDFFVFGLTNVHIKQHSVNNATPENGDTATFTVTFKTMVNQGLDNFDVTESTDNLTLTFGKKYWQITHIDSINTKVMVDSAQFLADLQATRAMITEDTTITQYQQGIELVKRLASTYPWLPSEQEVELSIPLIPPYLLISQ